MSKQHSLEITNKDLCKVRTITTFINLTSDKSLWQNHLQSAKTQCDKLTHALQNIGYQVQSIRIVTNPFGEYLNTQDLASAKADLEQLMQTLQRIQGSDSNSNNDNHNSQNNSAMRLRFAIGEAKTEQEVALLPELIRDYGDLCNACVNVTADELGILDNELIATCVQAVEKISQITARGEGNFNFTVNFNCDSYIPYFPASYHRGEIDQGFVIGLETPDLLLASLEQLSQSNDYQQNMNQAYKAMSHALQYHVDTIQDCVHSANSDSDWTYLGMDTSAAPSKDCTSMVDIYKALGVPYFGASGTVEISALLTRVFKSLKNVQAVGFSGLMLAVTEDSGLAQATIDNEFDIRSLLTYSSVCGIGLDTVPIAGDTPSDKLAALMRDTGTMAYRLNKPLTVRVFPVPNLGAGEMTQFESSDLCNCAVLAVV